MAQKRRRKRKPNNVTKYRAPLEINIGIIIMFVIVVYLVIEVFTKWNEVKPSVYCVEKSYIDNDFLVTGVALRDETLINSSDSGYINYYIRSGDRVGKNAIVYTVDETGSVYDYLAENAGDEAKLAAADYTNIKSRIAAFRGAYSDDRFITVYNFKYDLQNMVLEISNDLLIEKATSGNSEISGTFKSVSSDSSGVVCYYEDGYENVTPSTITKSQFDRNEYKKTSLKTGDIINSGAPVYKLINSEEWNIVAPVTDSIIHDLKDTDVVTIQINNMDYDVDCNFTIFKIGEDDYINIYLNKLMVDFLEERFVEVRIKQPKSKGLKIPVSSITTLEVNKFPVGFLTAGENSSTKNKVLKRVFDESGNVSTELCTVNIIKIDETSVYIDKSDFDPNDIIVKPDSDETFRIGDGVHKLTGVFSANKGTAEFKIIEKVSETDEFCVVKEGLDYSISAFDYILLDGESASEGQILY